MKEFRVEIRVKNNLLYSAIDRAGFDSVAAFSRACGVQQTVIGEYINLKLAPIKGDDWRESALRIAGALHTLPEELFPADYLRDVIQQNRVVREYSAEEIHDVIQLEQATPEQLMVQSEASARLAQAIAALPPRYQTVLQMRFGLNGYKEHSLDEIAKKFGVIRERIRQIENSALRRLKHPARGITPAMIGDFAP